MQPDAAMSSIDILIDWKYIHNLDETPSIIISIF